MKTKRNSNSIPEYLKLKINDCENCFLSSVRRKNALPVIGRGVIPATILFLGEAPGMSEELRGKAFIGRAGKLLDEMLFDSFYLIYGRKDTEVDSRIIYGDYLNYFDELPSYFITNTVLCRPTNEKMGDNRQPYPVEVAACARWVMKLYEIVNPRIVIFIGKVAEKYYSKEFRESISIRHPAYLLRGGGKNHPEYSSQIRRLSEVYKWLRKN